MSQRNLITVLAIALGCLVLAAVGGWLLKRGHDDSNPANAPSEMIAAIQTHFPDDWKQIQRDRKQAGADDIAIGAAFMQGKLPDVRRAPDAALVAVITAESALARQLQSENVQSCATYIMVGPTDANTYSQPSQVLLDRSAARTVAAARQGIDTPTRRTADPQTTLAKLQFAMHDLGVPTRLLEPDPASPLTTEEQCEFGVRLYETLLTLPAPEAAEIFANLKFAAR